jgi:hypothetical protein
MIWRNGHSVAAASIAAGIPVDLRDTATGLDTRNIQRLVTAINHASGRRPGTLGDRDCSERAHPHAARRHRPVQRVRRDPSVGRLDPAPRHRMALARAFGCARLVYNDALRAREEALKAGLPYITDAELSRRLALGLAGY